MNPLGRGAGRLDRVGMRVRVEASWAALNLARSRFPIKKFFFSFSNLFCKLQINLNSNQI
jgi:hypothetical protein